MTQTTDFTPLSNIIRIDWSEGRIRDCSIYVCGTNSKIETARRVTRLVTFAPLWEIIAGARRRLISIKLLRLHRRAPLCPERGRKQKGHLSFLNFISPFRRNLRL